MDKLIFLTEVLEEEDNLYVMIQELQEDVTGLQSQLSTVTTNTWDLLDVTGEISEKLQHTPTMEQMDNIIALLFLLVCFELMRLVRGWTKWSGRHGKVGE